MEAWPDSRVIPSKSQDVSELGPNYKMLFAEIRLDRYGIGHANLWYMNGNSHALANIEAFWRFENP